MIAFFCGEWRSLICVLLKKCLYLVVFFLYEAEMENEFISYHNLRASAYNSV